MKNVMIAQSGGPSSAINATLAGVVERALISSDVDKIYGSIHGIKGILEDKVTEIGVVLSDPKNIKTLVHTPSSALGSCRIKLDWNDKECFKMIFDCFAKYNIGYFVYIGGNDSMDTVAKLTSYARENAINDIYIMGAPKTIDNDLCEMDHSPGFGSAAKYISNTFKELWCDCSVYDIPTVTIVEIMGRHCGWLTAASALAANQNSGPHLIYLPEIPFDDDKFIEDVNAQLNKTSAVLVAISEGIRYENGTFVCEDEKSAKVDAFGHKALSGSAAILRDMVRSKIGCKVRAIEFSLMQRCAGHLVSYTDIAESKMLGSMAMDRALSGISGKVPVVKRLSSNPYRIKYEIADVLDIANKEKAVPRSWINERGNFVNKEMIEYLTPLIEGEFGIESSGGMPVHLNFL